MVEDGKDKPAIKIFSADAARIRKLHRLFQKLDLPAVHTACRQLTPKEWLTLWKADWKPAPLTRLLDVVPMWQRKNYKIRKDRGYIVMDTLLSFGTGLHETTRIMAQFIEDCRGRFASFIDVGTGTGILAMVAIKQGARQVMAIDTGDLSIEAARQNLKANRLKATVKKADIKKFSAGRTYDFVAANLITHDLIACQRQLLKLLKPGGYLAVSGISLENLPQLERAYHVLPLTRLKLQKGKQWAGLLYQKRTL